MLYIKTNFGNVNLTDDGINTPNVGALRLSFKCYENVGLPEIKDAFSNMENITICGSNLATEDEYVSSVYENYTTLDSILYDAQKDVWTVTMLLTSEIETRISELEEAMNFLLMGGE